MARKKAAKKSPDVSAEKPAPKPRPKATPPKASPPKATPPKATPASAKGDSGNGAPEKEHVPIVGIGASAGGLAALKQFFAHVPGDSGAAFVVVVHLSPDHKSHLAELLQPHVRMPVQQVSRTVRLEKDRVYVIPPGANLNTIDTHLRLSKLEEDRRERAPIDHFFRTLAETQDGHAIGVILTGTGSDGTLGVKEIRGRHGLVLVQDPGEAEYDGMPQSALASGAADAVLPLHEIAPALLRFLGTRPRVELPADGAEPDPEQKQLLHKVFAQIRARTGRDFSSYKQSTVLRRIRRRMQLHQVELLEGYLEMLRKSADEVRALADDMLITVTNFFRDTETFEYFAGEVLPQLMAGKGAEDELRVWSVGCATGEEAYSLAMLLVETLGDRETAPRIQVFASDLHERSLRHAREGAYPGDIGVDVSPERLKRFFVRENGGYRVRKELREMVVFAPHNLLGDPPFSRMDIIFCRNLLIYLRREVQRDVAELFHYALRPEGYLLVGSSETIDAVDLFRVVDKKRCLYQKRNVPACDPRLPVFPMASSHRAMAAPARRDAAEPIAYGRVHQQMLERYAPPSVLVGPDEKIVHYSEHAGRYLVHPGGGPTTSVFKLVRDELRMELRSALRAALERGRATSTKAVTVRFDGGAAPVVLHVWPAYESQQEGFALVIFDERSADDTPSEPPPGASGEVGAAGGQVAKLESELEVSRQRLQAVIEEYETGQEEMKASNEELQSANEELRSTMEELETSKEELQSMNEELQTVNQENRHKVEELGQLSGDLQNLLAATDIATLFLDRQLRILRFTPRVADLFSIRITDRGRPVSDLTHRLAYQQMTDDAQRVLDKLVPVEREVRDHDDGWYLARVLPYRTADDRIDGVVLTFVDITARRRAEERVRRSERLLAVQLNASQRFHEFSTRLLRGEDKRAVFEEMLEVAASVLDSRIACVQLLEGESAADGRAAQLRLIADIGLSRESAHAWRVIAADSDTACGRALKSGKQVILEDLQQEERIAGEELEPYRLSGIRAVLSTPLFSRDDKLLGMISTFWREPHRPTRQQLDTFEVVGGLTSTLLEQLLSDEELRAAKTAAENIIETLHEPLVVLNRNLTIRSCNPAFYHHFHVRPDETQGKKIYDLGNGQWNLPELRRLLEDVLPDNNSFVDYEVDHRFESIGRRVLLLNARRLEHEQLILLGIRDITERTLAEQAVRESEQRFRALTAASSVIIYRMNPDWSEMQQLSGQDFIADSPSPTGDWLERYIPEDDRQAVSAAIQRAIDSREMFERDHRVIRLDGTTGWVYSRAVPILDERGEIKEWFGAAGDITAHHDREHALRESEERLRRAAEATGFGTYDYDVAGGRAIWAPELYALTGVPAGAEPDDRLMLGLVHPEDRDRFQTEMEKAVGADGPGRHQMEFRIVRPDGATRWVRDTGQTFFAGKGADRRAARVVGTVQDITRQKQSELELQRLNESLEQQVAHRTAMLKLLQEVTRAANEARTVEQALNAAMASIAGHNGWSVGHVWRVAEDDKRELVTSGVWHVADDYHHAVAKLDEFRRLTEQTRIPRGEGFIGRVCDTGQVLWIDNAAEYEAWLRGDPSDFGLHAVIAFPIFLDGEVAAVMEFFSPSPTERDERFLEIMPDLGLQLGHVIQRKRLERRIADAAEREQRRIGQDIHDGVGQEITGLKFLAKGHAASLESQRAEDGEMARRLASGFETIQGQLRRIIRDLVPVEVDAQGLAAALQSLAERTAADYGVECRFEGDEAVRLASNLMSTHVYRIAQEAVSNAAKHAGPSLIEIKLEVEGDRLHLCVSDDGVGMPTSRPNDATFGIGSMTYRAELLGGKLTIEPRDAGGTVVCCVAPQSPSKREES
ncbi:CheR family methyltransferase [Botrimarina sp.]|uniref:CheR family methyltransferase n=1 Tax=Botrimarina sp. TaxID=2795802 RepID=UPI0032F08CCA